MAVCSHIEVISLDSAHMFLLYAACHKLDRMLGVDVNLDVGSLIMQAEERSNTILGRTTEEMIRPYAEYLIFGIDVATGIIIAISAAMAVIGFQGYYNHETSRTAYNRQRDN